MRGNVSQTSHVSAYGPLHCDRQSRPSAPEHSCHQSAQQSQRVTELPLTPEGCKSQNGEKILFLRGDLLVRHLVLPGGLAGTDNVMRFVADEISRGTYVNAMDQYHPAAKAFRRLVLNRPVWVSEVDDAVRLAREADLWRIHEEL